MTFIVDGTNGLTFPNSTIQASAGNVLQVVQGTYSTQVTNATSSYVDTGLTATITPKFSTSKILVMVNQASAYTATGIAQGGAIRLVRDSTTISFSASDGTGPYQIYYNSVTAGTNGGYLRECLNYLDSPATTSAVVYKTQGRAYTTSISGIAYYQYAGTTTGTSTIILMEIAA